MNDTPDDPEDEEETSEIEEEIATLAMLISQARELVADGNTIDLSNLSDRVGEFCASVAANPPSDADSIKLMIDAIIQDLNSLAQEINEQQPAFTEGPKNKGNGS